MREALPVLGFPSNPSCLRFSYNLLPTRKKVMILFYITGNLYIYLSSFDQDVVLFTKVPRKKIERFLRKPTRILSTLRKNGPHVSCFHSCTLSRNTVLRPNSWTKSRTKSLEFSSLLFTVTSTALP